MGEKIESLVEIGSGKMNLQLDLETLKPLLRPLIRDPINDLLNVYTYVDFPNFYKSPEMLIYRMNFFGLLGLLTSYRFKEDRAVRDSIIYIKPNRTNHDEAWHVFDKIKASGFDVVFSRTCEKDVDPLIIESIMGLKEKQQDICLNLASGDSDYCSVVENLKKHQEAIGRQFVLRIFSWKNSLSSEWKKMTDKIYYWEDLVKFVDYPAGRYFPVIDLEDCFREKHEINGV